MRIKLLASNGYLHVGSVIALADTTCGYPLDRMALTDLVRHRVENSSSIEAGSFDVVDAVIASAADVSMLILDLNLIQFDRDRQLIRLLKKYPDLKVLMTSDEISSGFIKHFSGLGASGWLSMRDSEQNVASTMNMNMNMILRGDKCFPPIESEQVNNLCSLTRYEIRVLEQLNLGLLNKQISDELSISIHTAKYHISHILKKLGVSNRTHAVSIYQQNQRRKAISPVTCNSAA